MTTPDDLAHEREIRTLVDEYERKLTDARVHELEALSTEHRISHQVEHEYWGVAIDKATGGLASQVSALVVEVDRVVALQAGYLTVDRWEREHAALSERRIEDHEQLRTLLAQLGTLRALVVFLGLPGLAALGWMAILAISGYKIVP